jgi:hypothetical protein
MLRGGVNPITMRQSKYVLSETSVRQANFQSIPRHEADGRSDQELSRNTATDPRMVGAKCSARNQWTNHFADTLTISIHMKNRNMPLPAMINYQLGCRVRTKLKRNSRVPTECRASYFNKS